MLLRRESDTGQDAAAHLRRAADWPSGSFMCRGGEFLVAEFNHLNFRRGRGRHRVRRPKVSGPPELRPGPCLAQALIVEQLNFQPKGFSMKSSYVRRLFVMALVAISFSLVAQVSRASCDTERSALATCERGQGGCTLDSQCGQGEQCVIGRCVERPIVPLCPPITCIEKCLGDRWSDGSCRDPARYCARAPFCAENCTGGFWSDGSCRSYSADICSSGAPAECRD